MTMMHPLAAEFRELFQLYVKLGEDLAKIMNVDDSKDSRILSETILKNHDCLIRIEKMNSRVLHLSNEWKQSRGKLAPDSEKEIHALAKAARTQAMRLQELCSAHMQKLQKVRDRLEKDLAELSKGAQYLKSVKPPKHNYPKFIDSRY